MKALVFAAGLGTRLRPLTDSIPKALVSVGGVPMLERVILKLKACGIDAFVVNTCHFAVKIEEFLASRQDFGVHIDLSFEPGGPYETGGGIKFAHRLLGEDRFLAHNVDMLGGSDLAPLFSAKSVDGVRAYERVRQGEEVELKPSPIVIYGTRVLSYEPPVLKVEIQCSKGTYIRAFARDLGAALGSGAHLSGLVRTASGGFSLENALSISEFETFY